MPPNHFMAGAVSVANAKAIAPAIDPGLRESTDDSVQVLVEEHASQSQRPDRIFGLGQCVRAPRYA